MLMKSDLYFEHRFRKVKEVDTLSNDQLEIKSITVTSNIFPVESLYNSVRWFESPGKFSINVHNMFWRFNDNMVYILIIEPGTVFNNKELLVHKYVLKTMHKQFRSITEDTGFDFIDKLEIIEKYMFHKDLVQVGIDLVDNLMWTLGEEYKKRKNENKKLWS